MASKRAEETVRLAPQRYIEREQGTMTTHKRSATRIGMRRMLMTSAVVALACFFSQAAMAQLVPNAGPNRTVIDTDGLPGETVTLNGSGSQGAIVSYVWTNAQGAQIATGPTPTVRLPDGINQIGLVISDDDGSQQQTLNLTASSVVTITVQPTVAPVANPGVSRAVADTDNRPGEAVTLDASASSDLDGTIVSYQWFRNGNTPLGNGAVLNNVQLPDGANQITLTVRDNVGNTTSSTVTLTVGAAAATPVLAADTGLLPNELALAKGLDDLCARLAAATPGSLTPAQQDLLARCNAIIFEPNAANREQALEELGAQDMNAIRMQAITFSQTQYQSVMDRLLALRSGERGISLAGLSLNVGGKMVPAEQLLDSLGRLLGGGASADEGQPGGLLSNRLGFWLRGNYGSGEKGSSPADAGFDSDQWGLTAGVDYRFGESTVGGLSLGYGRSDLSFNPSGQGSLDSKALNASLYGSMYFGNVYIDGVLNYGDNDYDSKRRILYTAGGTAIDRTAVGSSSGRALSGGLSAGYDFVFGGFTVSPTLGYFFVDTDIDPFTERGANGLNLAYAEQNYESSAANFGFRVSYAWKQPWGVLIPHFRTTYVREFENAIEIFGVRFADDPFASSANPTAPIIVQADEPDESYLRFAAGVSAQFPYDISGYFEYQRLQSFQYVDFHDFTIGVRIQHIFR